MCFEEMGIEGLDVQRLLCGMSVCEFLCRILGFAVFFVLKVVVWWAWVFDRRQGVGEELMGCLGFGEGWSWDCFIFGVDKIE